MQQARASASSAAPSSSQAPASSSAAASSADDEDADLTRCEVGLRQHIELLREHERLRRKLAEHASATVARNRKWGDEMESFKQDLLRRYAER